ncbi:hypothetical protein [Candidatus Neomicrothrix sp.]|uniref:hypothetical protein n=1 Tax=Candidatus Neomicrothrix sp. TaxID=2719034 RepID=UPI002C511737|nr:hypothetical protein [Candidatus Microthrix sp.]HMS49425.1 hypothetical protein [Candidatus Microthrix sp.]
MSELDVGALKAEIAALSRVDALVVARRSAVVTELARRDGDVAEQLRRSGNMSSRQARKAAKTAQGLAHLPKTREALERGEIGAGQAEALASRMDKPEQARNVRNNEDSLLEKAKSQDVDEFARTMRQEDIAGSPDHGNTHAQRQRQARKASTWIDGDTGMHLLFAEFDPITGARISTQLATMVDQLWRAEHLPGPARPPTAAEGRPGGGAPPPPRRPPPQQTGGRPTTRRCPRSAHLPQHHQERRHHDRHHRRPEQR